jgi:glyceraldehyde-3-phosphate dehydrogenase/erythrose-4-phosphate dehydrogenase
VADDGKLAKIFAWYDNEWGSTRMVDVALLVESKL